MSELCKHGRKPWKCSLCRAEEAENYGRECPRKFDLKIDKTFSDNVVQNMKDWEKDVAKTMGITNTKCPIPKSLWPHHVRVQGLEFVAAEELHDGKQWLVTWGEGAKRFRMLYDADEVEGLRALKESVLDPRIVETIRGALGVNVGMSRAMKILYSFLEDRFGHAVVLNDYPEVEESGLERRYIFPTNYGIKETSDCFLYSWVAKNCRPMNEVTDKITKDRPIGITLEDHKAGEIVSLDTSAPLWSTIDVAVTQCSDGTRVEILGLCEIMLNGKKYRAVKEGDTVHIVTDDYRKLI